MLTLIKDIFHLGPRNIRRKLFRDVLLVVLIAVGATIFLSFNRDTLIKDKITKKLISESSRLVQNRFISYLIPFETSLQLTSRILTTFATPETEMKSLQTFLAEVLAVHPDVAQVTVVDEAGESIRLIRNNLGYRVDTGASSIPENQFIEELFTQARDNGSFNAIKWRETFSIEDHESGMAVSIVIPLPSRPHTILSYFIPAEKFITFISDVDVEQEIDFVIFNDSGLLVSKQWIDANAGQRQQPQQGTGGEAVQNNSLRFDTPAVLASPATIEVVESWKDGDILEQGYYKATIGGNIWWAGFTPLDETELSSWIGVVVPEKAIVSDAHREWVRWWSVLAAIMLLALAMTVYLVRRYSFMLKDLSQNSIINTDLQNSIMKMIGAGESSSLEFKSTMRHNLQAGKHAKEIELAWLKAVTAFLNSDGGVLLIGVSDAGEVIGIASDNFANEDKCRLHFKNLVNSHIGPNYSRYIHLQFCAFDDKTVLLIECERVRSPVFLKIGKSEEFLVRSGPSNMKLSMSQMITYLADR